MSSDAYLKVILEAKDMSAKGFKSFQTTVAAVTRSVFSLQGGLASLGVALTGREIFDAGRNMAQLEKAFVEITGSSAAMGKEFDFVRDVAERMGQNFYDLIPTYKGILAATQDTNLEGEKTRDIFEGIIRASATLGLSSDQTTGALRAIEQMMSKGKVQAEELRGQLGERLPGAFKLAAEAMNVSTAELNKMLDNGKVLADDLLPKLAEVLKEKYSGEVDKATAAVNSMAQSWEDLKVSMAGSGFLDSVSGAITNVADTFKDEDFKQSMSDFAENLGVIVERMSGVMKYGGMRSIGNTLEQGTDLAKRGLLDWDKFINAGFQERQRMVDAILKSPRVTGGYTDNDAIEAEFNNPAVALTPALSVSGADADGIAALEAFQKTYAEYSKKISADAAALIASWDNTDAALERFFSSLDEAQGKMGIDAELESWFGDLDGAEQQLNDLAAQTEKSAEEMKNAFSGWASSFSSTLNVVLWDADVTFDSILESYGRMITQMIIQKKMIEPLFSMDWSGVFSGGGSSAAPVHVGAGGNTAFKMAGGGVIGEHVIGVGMRSGASYEFGEGGVPEVVLPTRRAAGGSAGGGVNMTFNVIDNVGVQVTQQQRQGPNGPAIDVTIDELVAEKLGRRDSAAGRMLRNGYGATTPLVRR